MITWPTILSALQRPDVLPVLIFLGAIALHILCGAVLHLIRRRDFDWHLLGKFVEDDFASKRGLAILTTFVVTLTAAQLGGDWRAAFAPAWLALVASCAAATLPVLRDVGYELFELFTGTAPSPPVPAVPPSASFYGVGATSSTVVVSPPAAPSAPGGSRPPA